MKRFFAAAMALAMTAGLLSGCGNQTAGNSQGDNAQASEAIEATLHGDDISTAFNPQFLIDGLQVLDTDYVRFGFTHPTKPAVITGQKKLDQGEVTQFRYLLMPIRFGI